MLPLTGYSDRLSARAGQSIAFKISSQSPNDYKAHLVRIISGDPNPEGPGIVEEDLTHVFSNTFSSRTQLIRLGSYAEIGLTDNAKSLVKQTDTLTFKARIWPTLAGADHQCVASLWNDDTQTGLALFVHRGHMMLEATFEGGDSSQTTAKMPVRERVWIEVEASISLSSGKIRIHQRSLAPNLDNTDSGKHEDTLKGIETLATPSHIRLAALESRDRYERFNGKIESPMLFCGEGENKTPLAHWDFSQGMSTQLIKDSGPYSLNGQLRQIPGRAMRGSNWTGDEHCWRHAPNEYGAIHFHDDDLYDCEWKTDFTFTVPETLASGVYAIRMESDLAKEMLPFFVRPPKGERTADIVYLAPTFTYTVYGNHARGNTDASYRARTSAWNARPWTPDEHREYGFSTYNFHTDGSGIAMASRLRPMITMRSEFVTFAEEFTGSGLRHFAADTHLISWLEHEGLSFDVVTDEDLHEEGVDLITGYAALVTASHPEYHTPETRGALQTYTERGGHLMYLGGNGFYWRVAVNDEVKGAVEIRRAETGIRAWAAEPGEYYHALDGGYGGTWRRNGRPPQELAGVGFSGQGKFQGSYYRRNKAADEKVTAWVFDGIQEDIVGDFGLSGGGAAGFEVDRVDHRLGSVEHIHILATSENHQQHFMLVPEEHLTHLYTWPGESTDNIDNLIRADMVYFKTLNNGGVFSTGSITWCGSLPSNNYDNNIAKITGNVLRHFVREGITGSVSST